MKNKHISLFWVDKLRNIIDQHPNDPERALYEFEDWAILKEKEFNKRLKE